MNKYIFAVSIVLSLAGCTTTPKLETNSLKSISKENNMLTKKYDYNLFQRQNWWENSQDQNLNLLIEEILSNNSQIKIAKMNVEKALASIQEAKRANISSVDLVGSGSRSHIENKYTKIDNKYANMGLPINDLKNSETIDQGVIGLQAGYVIDLWGKFKALEQESQYAKEAQELQSKWITLNISTSVADIYGKYILLNNESNILKEKSEIAEKLYSLEKIRYNSGLGDEASVLNIENSCRELKNAIKSVENNKQILKNTLLVLNNSQNSEVITSVLKNIDENKNYKFSKFMNTPEGIDSDLIVNRPDVEYYLKVIDSQKEKLKSIKADYYPRITLTGSFQYHTLDVQSLIEAESTLLSIGPSLYLPLFNRNSLNQKYKMAGMDVNIFIEEYNNNLIKAYQDVNNNLASLKVSDSTLESQNKNLKNSEKIFSNNETLYGVGNISNYQLLQSKLSYLNDKLKNSEKEYDVYSQQINLINSLGGYYKEQVK